MSKSNAFTIGWMTALAFSIFTVVAIKLIHDFIIFIIACSLVALASYLAGIWVTRQS